jgi:hypothetical protein
MLVVWRAIIADAGLYLVSFLLIRIFGEFLFKYDQ